MIQIPKETFREMAIGRFVIKKNSEVGVDIINQDELKAYEDGVLWAWDYFNREQTITNKIPLYSMNNLPSSKL